MQSVTLRGRFATSTVRGFAVARRNVYARESIRNNLIMYFLVGFMFQQLDRLQILAENDHFECRREWPRSLMDQNVEWAAYYNRASKTAKPRKYHVEHGKSG